MKVGCTFEKYRNNIVGINQTFTSPFGEKTIRYFDWTASGRLYQPIEEKMLYEIGPYVANTHTESNITSSVITEAYHEALKLIKQHVKASARDCIILDGTGMTGVINKFQRMLGLKVPEKFKDMIDIPLEEKPIVFITHMEHHSNHISWSETICDVEIIQPNSDGNVDTEHLKHLLQKYSSRKYKIGSFTACSNVTGVETPYHALSKIMHEYDGISIVDFSASAAYVNMDMHPADPMEKLDAIVFSPHKFLGGPGTSGVLIFDRDLCNNQIPDHPGGGTVAWTNPWGGKKYVENIEERESGGTPGFLQAIKTALCIQLKEEMGADNMREQETKLLDVLWTGLSNIPDVHLLAENQNIRLPIVSFFVPHIPYPLLTKLLNDVHGIQVRGGCSCAGTYGHFLLNIDKEQSNAITNKIDAGNLSEKPGWVRVSLHPTMTTEDVEFFVSSVQDIIDHIDEYEGLYELDKRINEYKHKEDNYEKISFFNQKND